MTDLKPEERTRSILRAALVAAALLGASHQLGAMTVEQYKKAMSEPTSLKAAAAILWLDGLADGLQLANLRMRLQFIQNPLPKVPTERTMLYCTPPSLALNEENNLSILNKEIELLFQLAGGDADLVKQINESPVDAIFFKALERTFPCSAAKVRELGVPK
jgi:hypothetical protein